MAELIASALIALAAIAFVLEPLARAREPVVPPPVEGETAIDTENAEQLVGEMKDRLGLECGKCGHRAGRAVLFCPGCGATLLSPR